MILVSICSGSESEALFCSAPLGRVRLTREGLKSNGQNQLQLLLLYALATDINGML